ncbi:hypothetical protein HY256_11570 [Candidatus Sumerlaeota bacterium]|nr:hypothetical protein [Candidatus Sumerlaeota bacterium]
MSDPAPVNFASPPSTPRSNVGARIILLGLSFLLLAFVVGYGIFEAREAIQSSCARCRREAWEHLTRVVPMAVASAFLIWGLSARWKLNARLTGWNAFASLAAWAAVAASVKIFS